MTGSPQRERCCLFRSTPLVGKPSLAVSLVAHMSFFATGLKRSLCNFKPIEDQPVLIAAGLPFKELHRTVPGILLFLTPFPGIVHPLHAKSSDRDAVADNDKVKDRIGSVRRGITQDRPEHALDPVRDIASAFAQRHRRKEFPFEALMLIVMLIFASEELWQILVSNAVEETVLDPGARWLPACRTGLPRR
jgi:hypothetical protein